MSILNTNFLLVTSNSNQTLGVVSLGLNGGEVFTNDCLNHLIKYAVFFSFFFEINYMTVYVAYSVYGCVLHCMSQDTLYCLKGLDKNQ